MGTTRKIEREREKESIWTEKERDQISRKEEVWRQRQIERWSELKRRKVESR